MNQSNQKKACGLLLHEQMGQRMVTGFAYLG